MRKILKYEVVSGDVNNLPITAKITEQSYRCEKFGLCGEAFREYSNYALKSCCFPQNLLMADNTVYVRGDNNCVNGNDNSLLVFEDEREFNIFKELVKLYNAYEFSEENELESETIVELLYWFKQYENGSLDLVENKWSAQIPDVGRTGYYSTLEEALVTLRKLAK